MRRELSAPGIPKGQPRPRAFSRNGHARVFDPGTAEGWKSAVAVAAQDLHRERIEREELEAAGQMELL